ACQVEAALLLGDARARHLLGGLLALDALAFGVLQLVVELAHFGFFAAGEALGFAKSRLIMSPKASANSVFTCNIAGSAFLNASTTCGSYFLPAPFSISMLAASASRAARWNWVLVIASKASTTAMTRPGHGIASPFKASG